MKNAGGNRNTGWNGGGVLLFVLYFLYSPLFLFFSLFFFLRSSLFTLCTKYSTAAETTGRDGTGATRVQSNTGQDRTRGGVGADEHIFCCFFSTFSTLLYYYYSHSSSPTIMEGRSRAVRDVIRPTPAVTTTLDGTAGQVGGGWEEEVEGWG